MLERPGDAAEYYKQAQEIASHIGDGPGVAAFIRDRGNAAWATGKFDLAAELYRKALARSNACRDRWGEADSNRKLGNVAWREGDVPLAASLYWQALNI